MIKVLAIRPGEGNLWPTKDFNVARAWEEACQSIDQGRVIFLHLINNQGLIA